MHRRLLFLLCFLTVFFAAALPGSADICISTLTASGEEVTVPSGEPAFVDLLANDSHDCGAPLSIDPTSLVENCPGSVTPHEDGSITYFPLGLNESCSISYTVLSEDGDSASRTAVVTVGSGSTGGGGVTNPVVVPDQQSSHCPTGSLEKCCWHEITRAIDYRYRQNRVTDFPQDDPMAMLTASTPTPQRIPWVGTPSQAGPTLFSSNSENHGLLCETARYLWAVPGTNQDDSVAALINILDSQSSMSAIQDFGWMSRELFSPIYQGWIAASWLAVYNHSVRLAQEPTLAAKAKDWLRTYWTFNALMATPDPISEADSTFRTAVWNDPAAIPLQWNGLSLGLPGARAGKNGMGTDSNGQPIPVRALSGRGQTGHNFTALALDWQARSFTASDLWEPVFDNHWHRPLWVAAVFAGSDFSADFGGTVNLEAITAAPDVFGLELQEQANLRDFVNSSGQDPNLFSILRQYIFGQGRTPRCQVSLVRTTAGTAAWFGVGEEGDPGHVPEQACGLGTGGTGYPIYAATTFRDSNNRLIANYLTPKSLGGSDPDPEDKSFRRGNQLCWNDSPQSSDERCIDIPLLDPSCPFDGSAPGCDDQRIFHLEWSFNGGLEILKSPPPFDPPVITITSQPEDFPGSLEEPGFLAITASVDEPVALTYQWHRADGQPVTGTTHSIADGSELRWESFVPEDAGTYFCEVSAPGAATVISATAVVTVDSSQPPVVTERFHLSAAGPDIGDPLDGEPSDFGERIWNADAEALFGNGYLTHPAGTESLDAVGTISFNPASLPGAHILTVGADVAVSGEGWGAIGFSSSPSGSFIGSGELWILLRENGNYAVRQNGTAVALADCNAPSCVPLDFHGNGAFNRLKIQYDTQLQTVSAWINRERVLDGQPVDSAPANLPQVVFGGFTLNAHNGGAAERIKVDNFWAVAGTAADETDEAVLVSSDLPLGDAMLCGAEHDASVTLKNTGNTVWYRVPDNGTADPSYKWGHPGTDPFTSLDRIWLAAGERVLPGESRTFPWTMTAPSTADSYPISWQMIREDLDAGPPPIGRNAWFGPVLDPVIEVQCDNQPPEPDDEFFPVNPNGTFRFTETTLLSGDTDPDGDMVIFDSLIVGSIQGTIQEVVGAPIATFDYFAPQGLSGLTDVIQYQVHDGRGGVAQANVSFTIPLNRRPVPVADSASIQAGETFTFPATFLTGNDDDPDDDVIVLTSLTLTALTPGQPDLQPLPGPGPVTYEFVSPAGGASGDFVFEYLIEDEHGFTALTPGTLTITVLQSPPVAAEDRVLVPYGSTQWLVSDEYLLGNDTDANGDTLSVTVYGDPAFGTWSFSQFGQGFNPTPDFWQAGEDAFTYTVTDGHTSAQGLVRLLAEPVCDVYFGDGAESGDTSPWALTRAYGGGTITADTSAAAQGSYGFLVAPSQTTTQLYLEDDSPVDEAHFRMGFLLNPNDFVLASGGQHNIVSALAPGSNAFSLRMGSRGVRAPTGPGRLQGQRRPGRGPGSRDRVRDRAALASGLRGLVGSLRSRANDGGARLWIDGQLAAEILGVDNDERRVESTRIGAVWGIDPGFSGSFFFDSYVSCDGPRSRRSLIDDDFEADLSSWDLVRATGGGTVETSAAAALDGAQGLAIGIVEGAGQLHVRKNLERFAEAATVEFLFDPNSLAMVDGSSHPVFLGSSPSGAADGAAAGSFRRSLQSAAPGPSGLGSLREVLADPSDGRAPYLAPHLLPSQRSGPPGREHFPSDRRGDSGEAPGPRQLREVPLRSSPGSRLAPGSGNRRDLLHRWVQEAGAGKRIFRCRRTPSRVV